MAVGRRLAVIPELPYGFGLAQIVGPELEDGFGAGLRPELLASLHPPVDLFDHRLHRAGHDRQALPAIIVVPHPRRPVAQVSNGLEDQHSWIALAAPFRRWTEFGRTGFQLRQNRLHLPR